MTRDDIMRMAQEAGAMFEHMSWLNRDLAPVFERFAALVAAAEREALKEERRRDMAEICSLRESEESLREEVERLRADAERYRLLKSRVENYDGHACFPEIPCSPFDAIDAAVDAFFKQAALRGEET